MSEENLKKMNKFYPDVNPNPDFPAVEREILANWQADDTFEKSVEKPADGEFVFYDGPPFANGLPHYGHLLTGFVKDTFARYQTMQGKRVERRFGWDCHGLPAEMGSEKELGISGRQAIQAFGIDKFNEHCRTSVMKYTADWREYVTRQARWVDFDNDYKTMDKNFMESVLWAFKQLYDKGLVYEAHRVMPYSWAAETPLSNFETKLDNSYREREDKAITVAFELNSPPAGAPKAEKYYILAWTTTPWTLPSNLALGVNKDMEYVAYSMPNNEMYIVVKNWSGLQGAIAGLGENFSMTGQDLIGLTYKPLFPYFADRANSSSCGSQSDSTGSNMGEKDPALLLRNPQDDTRAFRILDGSSFVTDGDGTGIVHLAPAFGEEDQKCCEVNGIELVCPVDGQGKYTDDIFDIPSVCHPREGGDLGADEDSRLRGNDTLKLRGLNVIADKRKEETDPFNENQIEKFGLVNLRIIKWLKDNKKLIKEEQIKHNYPHCWRTDTPLIYRAMPSWYVEVTKFRDRAAELNQQINWIPAHIRDGQMGHMLKTAPDWSISRNRFWGTPIPVWRSKSGKIIVIGSIAELEELSGQKVVDLHRPYIDNITISKDGEEYTRVEDVFDCWFESGSMPFAQVHYPFENKDWFEKHFPADFITEYVGQTRGWFNTLIMLSTALFDKPPFKNCICHGVMLGEPTLDPNTGKMVSQKLSKRLKNYPEPFKIFDEYGADALRWFMLSSSVMRGNDLQVDKEGKFIRDVVRLAIKPIWNAYNFFTLYANADGIKAECGVWSVECGKENLHSTLNTQHSNIMDAYILAKMNQAVSQIEKSLDAYDTPTACDAVLQFFDALNNWYIRRNKERFWKSEHDADKQAAYDTLYTVLVTMSRACSPLLPLTMEEIYKKLTGEESVHLSQFPDCHPAPSTCHPREGGDLGLHGKSPKIPAQGGYDDVGDNEFIAAMDFAQDICNTALAIRSKNNIRVRQPLASLTLSNNPLLLKYVLGGSDKIVRYWNEIYEIIKSEVNVREIISKGSEDSLQEYAVRKIEVKSAILGKRLPEKMKQILPSSKRGEWKYSGDGVGVIICDELLKAESGEYTILLEPKPEYAGRAQALSTNDALVILDIELDDNLIAEGIARDIVRMIQQARKDADLNVSDKIKLHISANEKIAGAVASHQAYILEQVLAVEWLGTVPQKPTFVAKNELDGAEVVISFVVSA